MFNFHFVYADGTKYDVGSVQRVVYQTSSGTAEVSKDDILSAKFPLKTTYLYTSEGCVTVSGSNLIIIDVIRQTY